MAKVKKAEYIVDNSDSKFNMLVTEHFGDKLALNIVSKQKEETREYILSKLKVDTDVDTYTEYDFGGNGLIAVTPAYSTRMFESNKYMKFLEENNLVEKAKKKHIIKITKNVFSTITRFDSVTVEATKNSADASVIGSKRAQMSLSNLIDAYLGVSAIEKTIKNQIENRMYSIIKIGKQRFGSEGLLNTKIVCVGKICETEFKGSLNFKCEDKVEIDKTRVIEMLPSSYSKEEVNDIVKSGTRTVTASVVKIIKKTRQFMDKKEAEASNYGDNYGY